MSMTLTLQTLLILVVLNTFVWTIDYDAGGWQPVADIVVLWLRLCSATLTAWCVLMWARDRFWVQ